MRKLGLLGMAVLAGLSQAASGDDPRNQISSADNKQVALPETTAAANPAPPLAARSALAAEDTSTGKSNEVTLRSRPLNLTAKLGLQTRKLESPNLHAGMAANPSKLANIRANESKPNALTARDAKRTQAKASSLQQVAPFKTNAASNPRHLPVLDLSNDGGKSL